MPSLSNILARRAPLLILPQRDSPSYARLRQLDARNDESAAAPSNERDGAQPSVSAGGNSPSSGIPTAGMQLGVAGEGPRKASPACNWTRRDADMGRCCSALPTP